jgi:hypothetical protein
LEQIDGGYNYERAQTEDNTHHDVELHGSENYHKMINALIRRIEENPDTDCAAVLAEMSTLVQKSLERPTARIARGKNDKNGKNHRPDSKKFVDSTAHT